MTWFDDLTGCTERSPSHVRENLVFDGRRLRSHCNGKSWLYGELETPTLADLRQRARESVQDSRPISVREVIANVQHLHRDPANQNALFQVASQFNLLEMMAPDVTPERGVGIYERDPTQGPACAIAAGAGTKVDLPTQEDRAFFAMLGLRSRLLPLAAKQKQCPAQR